MCLSDKLTVSPKLLLSGFPSLFGPSLMELGAPAPPLMFPHDSVVSRLVMKYRCPV